MSEPIQTKICFKCKQIKPISEFYKHPTTKDGYLNKCKSCVCEYVRQWEKTATGKQSRKKYKQSIKGKFCDKRYYRSIKGQNQRKNYQKNGKHIIANIKYRINHPERAKNDSMKYRINYPERLRANRIIRTNIENGLIPKIKTQKCTICHKQAQEYHHPDYSKPLEVIPLCMSCHKFIHIQ